MAYFAELDSNNQVINVVVIDDADVTANGGDQSVTAENWVSNNVPHLENGVSWKQTSEENSFRKEYAVVGASYYDADKDMFIRTQPFPSWTLDTNGDWQPPVALPTGVQEDGFVTFDNNGTSVTLQQVYWDETAQLWTGTTAESPTSYKWNWNNSTNSWVFDKTVSV